MAIPVEPPQLPLLLTDVPDRGLRDRLEPVVDVRALLPALETSGDAVAVQVLDGDRKTVVRLLHERPATVADGPARIAGRLRLMPVRGYDAEAAAVGRRLSEAGLTLQPAGTGYSAALDQAGLLPDLSPRVVLDADLPAVTAVGWVLLSFLDEIELTLEGTIEDVDTEFLHDFRVSVRRSRAIVKLLAEVLPPALATWAGQELKWLGDLTTPVRDLDVHLLEVPAAAARLAGADPADLAPLTEYLNRLRAVERRRLLRGLGSARFQRFRSRWRESLEALSTIAEESVPATGSATGPTAESATEFTTESATVPAAELGARSLARADRRVTEPGSKITPDSPAAALHDLRKRCKELRYLLEVFAPLMDPADARGAVKELKALQDVLGTFQDTEVQREALYTFAADMLARGSASARTLLAMGQVAGRLHDQQEAARADFESRFAAFADPSVQRRMTGLSKARAR